MTFVQRPVWSGRRVHDVRKSVRKTLGTHRTGWTLTLSAGLLAAIGASSPPSFAQTRETLTTTSSGGLVDDAYRKAAAEFEKKFNVTIRWVPGTATENAARVSATKANPEFDIALMDSLTYDGAQRAGALAKFDPAIMTNLPDLQPQAKMPGDSAVSIGFILTGIFYNTKVFQEKGWAPPTSWDDLFRPEYCNRVGVLHPNVSYGTILLVMLAGGDIEKIQDGIARLAKLKGCVPTLEASSPKMEEKVQLGEYFIGVHGSLRTLALAKDGYPVRFIVPKEGTVLTSPTCSAVKGGKEKLAQEFCNWMIGPAAQAVLRDDALLVPVSKRVGVPDELAKFGMPKTESIGSAILLDTATVTERRRDWSRRVERAMSP